jgi:superfamily II DNA or RNA helicase
MHNEVPSPGSVVWIRRSRWRVTEARRDGDVVRLDVANRDRRATFLAPFDRAAPVRLSSRPRTVRAARALAELAGLLASTTSVRAPSALFGARADILPHQIDPVLAIIAGARRVLIADDVGLGKTIQAGLVLAELARRTPAFRALLLVPASLTAQWRHELASRFGIEVLEANPREFALANHHTERGRNLWNRAGVWLASPDYLKQPHVLGALPLTLWDVVVIDEAHDVCGDSIRHQVSALMARRARRVVLLTATPHSGDPVRFARLEGLGRFSATPDPLVTFRRTRSALGLANARRVSWLRVRLSAQESTVLKTLAAFESATIASAGHERRDAALLLLAVFRKRALSTMTALDQSLTRRLDTIEGKAQAADARQLVLAFDPLDDDFAEEDAAGLAAETGLARADERAWLGRLRIQTAAAKRCESKIGFLTNLVERTREPLVIFTEFRHSLVAIERALAGVRRIAVMHGGQNQGERHAALTRFLEGDASLLLATDVAGQGLNLQTRARWIVSLELPWNPARIQQRIGRVDRIGQTRPVHATLLVAQHDAETGLLSKLARRALAAQSSLGNDTLPDAAPPHMLKVARGLLDAATDDPIDTQTTLVTTCQAWARTARAVAALTHRRRTLALRWRHPMATSQRPRRATLRHCILPPHRAHQLVVVIALPLVDGTGALVEQHIVAAAIGEELNIRSHLAALHAVAEASARARTARGSRLLADVARQEAAVELALAEELHADARAVEYQPGLFSRQFTRAAESTREALHDLTRRAEARAAETMLRASVSAGASTIELILCPRR